MEEGKNWNVKSKNILGKGGGGEGNFRWQSMNPSGAFQAPSEEILSFISSLLRLHDDPVVPPLGNGFQIREVFEQEN